MVLGPLDKRAIRKRCQICAQRKVKCEGGQPCTYCMKRGLICQAQVDKPRSKLVLVHHIPVDDIARHTRSCSSLSTVSLNTPQDRFLNHFFTVFVTTNNFAIDLNVEGIISEFQSSPSLYHTINAVAALDLCKKTSPKKVVIQALQFYRTSVVQFQQELQTQDFLQQSTGLWTTFFLGLFELMYDVSGEGFVRHILYGTSKILQLRGPAVNVSGGNRSFFLTVRALEICRALIYSEPTFLSEPRWKSSMAEIWEGELIKDWHPKESMFDMMLECSELNQRIIDLFESEVSTPSLVPKTTLTELATTGLALRRSLDTWYCDLQHWPVPLSTSTTSSPDHRHILSTIYYHATSIYLTGIFSYRPQFNYIKERPSLPPPIIQYHVDNILAQTKHALQTTKLTGVLFFFPLRVAGARAVTGEQKRSIIEMLGIIKERSFVVADAFAEDLRGLWDEEG